MWLSHPVSFWIWNWKYLLTRFPLLSGFASHKALLNSFLYSNNGSFLSGAVLAFSFSMYYVSGLVWFGFFFTLFLLAHRLSHWTQDELLPKVFLLIVELGLFWPHTFFFYRRVFFCLISFSHGQLSLQFCSPWKSAQVYYWLWLSFTCPYSIWRGQNAQFHSSYYVVLYASPRSLKNWLVLGAVSCIRQPTVLKVRKVFLPTAWIPWGMAPKLKFLAVVFHFVC